MESAWIIVHPEQPKFLIGRLVATPGALETVGQDEAIKSLLRHCSGDWGEVDVDDKAANDSAVSDGTRILSAYTTGSGVRFWIITEADRSATTILLPEEY